MNPESSWKFVPQGDTTKGKLQLPYPERLQNWCSLLNFLSWPPQSWLKSTHHVQDRGRWEKDQDYFGGVSTSYFHWRRSSNKFLDGLEVLLAFQSWSPSTQKPILNQECFSTIMLTWEALQIKFSCVSNHIKANITAPELYLHLIGW